MKPYLIIATAFLASSSIALAQTDDRKQTPTSAPAESSHAAGHDAQSGKPETGEKENNGLAKKQGTDKKSPQDQNTHKEKSPK